MIVGVAKEIKNNENRVAMTPAGVHTLYQSGHRILVESTAGLGSGFSDEDYLKAGAECVTRIELFEWSEMICKVKEPLPEEYDFFRPGQILFTYLHLAPNRELTQMLLDKRVTGIAYETVMLPNGSLPLLTPMSEVAGRMATQIGANLLQKYNGGMGILLGGVPGVAPAEVVILGGGVVGLNAAKMAIGLGARVTILDVNPSRLAYLDDLFMGRVTTLISTTYAIAEWVQRADLLIGAVLIPGAKAPKLVSEEMVKTMKRGSVIVDVAIDQGGSIATIDRITTHDKPCYEKYGVIHYSVANMPGAVPKTSTLALTGATLPYIKCLCDHGIHACQKDEALFKGLNTYQGYLTNTSVAEATGLPYHEPMI